MECRFPPRRRKTAAERRAQYLRAEGRCVQTLLRAFEAINTHRGGKLSAVGRAFLSGLSDSSSQCPKSDNTVVPCKFYANGHCKFGLACKFAHHVQTLSTSFRVVASMEAEPTKLEPLNVNAVEFVPDSAAPFEEDTYACDEQMVRVRENVVACMPSSVSLQGRWETLPASGWDRIYSQFERKEHVETLIQMCNLIESLVDAEPPSSHNTSRRELQKIVARSVRTPWRNELQTLHNDFERKAHVVTGLDHFVQTLETHSQLVLTAYSSMRRLLERASELRLLVECYIHRMKRYRFVRAADMSQCHFANSVLADLIPTLDERSQTFWLNELVERYWSNHSWCTREQIERTDPFYLVQDLRPADRVYIDNGIFLALNGQG
eukprot:TRINITY_DN57102_c0_g1_i1.p1 TRINITY_DN57102_c0_g1~~TRINITY_DN57102_c0_g1_i1.p1  ORF type:complete len:378 (+),score=39.09 TRINITY_DN57102_c0_g1_i1:153-1286(+)